MAQSLNSPPPGRISQLLPTVKCSNCNAPVPLTELGEHICDAVPPLPKPPPSPSSLLPARLQGLVSRSNSQSPQVTLPANAASSPPRRGTPSINVPPSPRSNGPAPSPSFVRKDSAQLSPGWSQSHTSSRLSSDKGSSRNVPLAERLRSASAAGRDPPKPFAERERTYSSSSARPEPSLPLPSPNRALRDMAPSNALRSSDARPSLDDRRPSLDSRGQSNFRSRPSFDSRPPYESVQPLPRKNSYALESNKLSLPSSPLPPPSSPNPPQSPLPPPTPQPDTKIGGEAGMAGVGRRGYFAAAARAAMFTATAGHAAGVASQNADADGMDGRRANALKYLDTGVTNFSHCEFHFCFSLSDYIHTSSTAATPPLSPNSGYSSHSPGPKSPISPGQLNYPPTARSSTSTTRPPGIASSRTPSPSNNPANRVPFFEKFKGQHSPVNTTLPFGEIPKTNPLSPESESSHGLAYAESSDEDDVSELSKRLSIAVPKKSLSQSKRDQVRFPTVDEKFTGSDTNKRSASSGSSSAFRYGSTQSSASVSRSSSAASASTSNYSSKSAEGIERAMETLFEEGLSTATGSSVGSLKGRSNTLAIPLSPEQKAPKLPTRSLTSPYTATFDEARRTKKKKECMRCEKTIEGGRWIATDTGGVLCERCWKNMYLPKVGSLSRLQHYFC